jgi:putative membrane protein
MSGGGWLISILMIIFWLLFIAGIVVLAIWLVNRYRVSGSIGRETALDILNKRYARGEISREEYERMKQDIS